MSEELTYKLYSSTDCIPEQTMFDYIGNKLSPKEQHAVEKHMLDCELCADAIEGLRMVKDRSRIAAINQRISAGMAAPAEKKVVKINYYRITASIAAGIALLIGSVFVFRFLITNSEQDVAGMLEIKSIKADSISDDKNKATQYESAPVTEEAPPPPPAAKTETRDVSVVREENEKAADQMPQELNVRAARKPNAPATVSAEGAVAVTTGSTTTTVTPDANAPVQYEWTATDEAQKEVVFQEFAKDRDDSKLKAAKNSDGKYAEKAEEYTIPMKSLGKEVSQQNPSEKKKEEQNNLADLEQKVPALAETEISVAYAPQSTTLSGNAYSTIKADSISIKQNAPGYYTVAVVDQQAQFPGGDAEMLKFIQKNFNYGSENYKEQGITSTKIYVEFVVTKQGEITNVKIKKGINPALDKEAIRVIKSMPKWTPAKKGGKAVDMIMTYPIRLEFK